MYYHPDTNHATSVVATSADASERKDVNVRYTAATIIGNGSFGVVYQAKLADTGEMIAIKKVLQDKRYKNRELEIMRHLEHQNIVKLKYFFYSTGDKQGTDLFLNLILEYVPETVYRVNRYYQKLKQRLPMIYVKTYMYQLLRALGYIHSLGICHRDVKPQNMLVDPVSAVVKLCDFGSAKLLIRGEPNVAYICSRYYRAPELIFGSTTYGTAIDVWAAGCVLGELLKGTAFFPGESGVDQLVEIIKILGTPKPEEMLAMNPNYSNAELPQIQPCSWTKVFYASPPLDALGLISRLLRYVPTQRISPVEACCHSFFDELRQPTTCLPRGRQLPPLINFSPRELEAEPGWKRLLLQSSMSSESCRGHVMAAGTNTQESGKGPKTEKKPQEGGSLVK